MPDAAAHAADAAALAAAPLAAAAVAAAALATAASESRRRFRRHARLHCVHCRADPAVAASVAAAAELRKSVWLWGDPNDNMRRRFSPIMRRSGNAEVRLRRLLRLLLMGWLALR